MTITYLGDGVYVALGRCQVLKLYSSNGIATLDQVFIDFEMLQKLIDIAKADGFVPRDGDQP